MFYRYWFVGECIGLLFKAIGWTAALHISLNRIRAFALYRSDVVLLASACLQPAAILIVALRICASDSVTWMLPIAYTLQFTSQIYSLLSFREEHVALAYRRSDVYFLASDQACANPSVNIEESDGPVAIIFSEESLELK